MTRSTPKAVAVVDDHRLFLDGLSVLLQRIAVEFSVDTFHNPVDLVEALDHGKRYDLIICDLLMSQMNGLALADTVLKRHNVPVLMLSGTSSPIPTSEMQQLGVAGFVHKSADESVLQNAIQSVLDGKTYYRPTETWSEPGISHDYGRQVELAGSRSDLPKLTSRQVEVLQLVAGGATNGEIAAALSISENTVKSHLKQIFDIFRVTKRTACVRAARSLGVI